MIPLGLRRAMGHANVMICNRYVTAQTETRTLDFSCRILYHQIPFYIFSDTILRVVIHHWFLLFRVPQKLHMKECR